MNIVCYNVLYDMCYNENSQRFLVQWEMGILSDIGPVKLSDIISVEIMLKKILSTVIFKELLFSVRLYKEKTQTGEESLETHELGVLLIFWKINIASTQNESCFLFFDCLVNRGFKLSLLKSFRAMLGCLQIHSIIIFPFLRLVISMKVHSKSQLL